MIRALQVCGWGFLLLAACSHTQTRGEKVKLADNYQWLEQIDSPQSMAWVEKQNKLSFATLSSDSRFPPIERETRKILLAKDRLPYPYFEGQSVYNFWQDDHHTRGLWRRTTLNEYQHANINWEVVLDIDELGRKEKESWVFRGAKCLAPGFERCLVALSRGGKDAHVVREFDTVKKKFVKNGFFMPEAKSAFAWLNEDTLLVATDWGPGSLTTSGYPRIVKLWHRGESLNQAKFVYEASAKHMSAVGYTLNRADESLTLISDRISFYSSENFIFESGKLTRIAIPSDAEIQDLFAGHLLIQLRSDWIIHSQIFKAGSLISIDKSKAENPNPKIVFAPSATRHLQWISTSRNAVLLNILDNVRGRILLTKPDAQGEWKTKELELPDNGMTAITACSPWNDKIILSYESFLISSTLYLADDQHQHLRAIKHSPSRFKAADLIVEQKQATSQDGTTIPYFVIHNKNLNTDGSHPTILYGYGGFEISLTPSYMSHVGKVWLEKGGIYAVANIRGGGEFGPAWHKSALRENRQRAYDDFISVAEDLIRNKITSPQHLGISGGSNGGLLVGVALTQRPDLFRAVFCRAPLLDMMRYSHLLAGASWMEEYGDPDDPKMAEIIIKYSPYQNVRPHVKYPPILFYTSTRDDRVHPAHARKMAARLEEYGNPVLYYENAEGGHSGAADLEQEIKRNTLMFTFFARELGLSPK